MRAIGFASLLLSIALAGGVFADRAARAGPPASQALLVCEDPVVTESVVDETRQRRAREMLEVLGAKQVIPLNTRGYNYHSEGPLEARPRPPAEPAPKQSVPTEPPDDAPPAAAG